MAERIIKDGLVMLLPWMLSLVLRSPSADGRRRREKKERRVRLWWLEVVVAGGTIIMVVGASDLGV